jgi:glycosyltransferase involved in cell wall biosynthesis
MDEAEFRGTTGGENEAAPKNWLVFGDDWGAHPSTTQHLIHGLPPRDRVCWVNSLGMRAPKLSRQDLRRVVSKLRQVLQRDGARRGEAPAAGRQRANFELVHPRVAPFHLNAAVRRWNSRSLQGQLTRFAQLQPQHGCILAANPVAAWYLPPTPLPLVYLRLDEYGLLPGCDAEVVAQSEAAMYARCQLVVHTAPALRPADTATSAAKLHLPQGVDTEHFATVPIALPRTRTVGFFGLLAEWLDYDLILQVAQRATDWTFEFVGPVRFVPDELTRLPNVRLLPAVPYSALPAQLHHWDVAWLPFRTDGLTQGVNPLKLREYLAAGFPVICTPLPAVADLADILPPAVRGPEDVLQQLTDSWHTDSVELRRARRTRVQQDSWQHRSAVLRAAVHELANPSLLDAHGGR